MEDSLPLRGDGGVVSAGLFVMPKTAAGFNDFVIGGDSTGAACTIITIARPSAKAPAAAISLSGSDYLIFDLTGRLVKRMGAASAMRMPKARGMYIIRKADEPALCVKTSAPMR